MSSDSLSAKGLFNFRWGKGGGLDMDVKELQVNGLPIARFGWAWIGMAVAEGIIANLGAAVFGAIQNTYPSLYVGYVSGDYAIRQRTAHYLN
jgi:hypothetical protein